MKRFEHAINALVTRKSRLEGRIFHGNYGSEHLRARKVESNAEIMAEISDIDDAIKTLKETHDTHKPAKEGE